MKTPKLGLAIGPQASLSAGFKNLGDLLSDYVSIFEEVPRSQEN